MKKLSELSDSELIRKIAIRARRVAEGAYVEINVQDLKKDLTMAHKSSPLDLLRLLKDPGDSFSHDVIGIMRNIDRKTGELKNCFRPRFSKRVGVEYP